MKAMKDLRDAWDEAIRYYNNDQSENRDGSEPNKGGSRHATRRLNDTKSSTENIVYSNINAQLPELYAKNPEITVTAGMSSDDDEWESKTDQSRAVEKLVNVLFRMRAAPGINIKPKAKKAVVVALLANRAWLECGYTTKDNSSEQAMQDLVRLSGELVECKTTSEIQECEGHLQALEEKIDFLQPSGPTVTLRMPHQVIVDPDHNDPWLTDANWVMVEDMMPTEYVNAMFGQKSGEEGDDRIMSVYEPTHVLDGGGDNDEDTFSLFDDKLDHHSYGFDSQNTFNKAKRTKVWRVWDKTTRRLELYSDKDWTWPIWVWDDPYKLDTFYPLTPLWFHENPVGSYSKGEVSYYLDQQDQINSINDEAARALHWARRNIFFDKNKVDFSEVEKILKGPDATATGLDVPEGMDPTKMIFSLTPPSINFKQLFDKEPLYKAVDRIAATNDAMRGEQFKTNTTNKAIDYYSTQGNLRMDERLDAVEDMIGDVGWKVAQLCLRFMPADTVNQLTGLKVDEFWRPMDSLKDFQEMSMTVVGGSTQKLSSAAKKQQAVQLGQVLSQFSKAAPGAVLRITLRMFGVAFDDMVIREEDWEMIGQEVAAAMGGGQPGAPPGPGGQPPPPGGGDPQQQMLMVADALQQLPPPLLKALGNMLAQGVPPAAIAQQLLQGGGGGRPTGAPVQ
jgi:hypothetical protein